MQHKKKITKKTALITSICAVVLIGGASYGAYNYTKTADAPTEQTQEPLNPTAPKKSKSLFPDTSKDKKKSTISPKEKTNDSSLADFRSDDGATVVVGQERKQALETLNQQVTQEQQDNKRKQAQPQPMAEPTKPKEEKPNQEDVKPTPKPQPDPEPKPEPPTPPVILIDYSVLSELVTQAQGIDLSLYLSSSIAQFNLELAVSQRILEEDASSQDAVNNQVARLQQAIDQMVLKGNKATLQATYDHSKTIVTDIYTTETVKSLEDAQKEAKELLDIVEIDQATLDRVQSTLQQAIDGLKEKEEPELSLTYLNRVIIEANQLNFDEYTPMTVQAVKDKVAEINTYIEAGNVTKEENERWTTELRHAIDHLQKKANTSTITQLLAEISGIDRTLYTAESLQVLDLAVVNANEQLLNEGLTQVEADSIYLDLCQAFTHLDKKEG